MRSELNRQPSVRIARFMRYPTPRYAVAIALVIERHDFVSQGLYQRLAISVIVDVGRQVRLALSNGETVSPIIGFSPPAIEDRKVQSAVEYDLHTACAGCFERDGGDC